MGPSDCLDSTIQAATAACLATADLGASTTVDGLKEVPSAGVADRRPSCLAATAYWHSAAAERSIP